MIRNCSPLPVLYGEGNRQCAQFLLALWLGTRITRHFEVSRWGLNGRPDGYARVVGWQGSTRLPVFPPSMIRVEPFHGLEGLSVGRDGKQKG